MLMRCNTTESLYVAFSVAQGYLLRVPDTPMVVLKSSSQIPKDCLLYPGSEPAQICDHTLLWEKIILDA